MYTKLKEARERCGLTQEEVAKKAGISWRAYQNYELGERVPKVDIAIQIARALNTKVEKIFW